MREMKPCHHTVSEDVVYKEVVVIGNGPSGMVTSFMLAGNVPYLKDHIPEDLPIDEMLRARLQSVLGHNLYEVDLSQLAEGLEGRSHSPVPLLMDNLLRPCADLGIEADSLIEWKFDVDKQIEHIVLGREPPGGAWHTFPHSVRTLSPGSWLSLPPHSAAGSGRLGARAVANYCRRYVRQCRLQRYFRSGVVVTSVTLAPPPPAAPCRSASCPLNAKWCVSGYDTATLRPFRYRCARAVLAAGGAARANTLGAGVSPRAAAHHLDKVERALDALKGHVRPGAPPPQVLVVGSGVSAADALRLTLGGGLAAAHAHRDPAPALAALPPALYPDYYQVYRMMSDGPSGQYENYSPYPEHAIVKITHDTDKHGPTVTTDDPEIDDLLRPKRVKLRNVVTNETVEIYVSLIAVLIGTKPDLFFLQTNMDYIDYNDNEREEGCHKCAETKHAAKRRIEDENKCFLKNHWHYLKTVLGQSIQSCKSKYLSAEINGNTETKCVVPDCNREKENCTCNNLDSKDKCECQTVHGAVKSKLNCRCEEENPYSNGIGFGLDPAKPVDCRSNPVAVDKSTHELINAPSGMYALGPLTADNFIRFIPGGALAIVSHIHKQKKENAE